MEIPAELQLQVLRKLELATMVRKMAEDLTIESARTRTLIRAEVLEREAKEIEGWAKPTWTVASA